MTFGGEVSGLDNDLVTMRFSDGCLVYGKDVVKSF